MVKEKLTSNIYFANPLYVQKHRYTPYDRQQRSLEPHGRCRQKFTPAEQGEEGA